MTSEERVRAVLADFGISHAACSPLICDFVKDLIKAARGDGEVVYRVVNADGSLSSRSGYRSHGPRMTDNLTQAKRMRPHAGQGAKVQAAVVVGPWADVE